MSLSKPLRPHKPRFKDWLLYVLDNELCDDAKWKDRSRKTAIIRWPHKSRGTWTLEKDAKLFKMWAVTSGKYRANIDNPNPKSWKCNFRMNLNICKNIVELKHERVAKGPNACRVFKFLDRRTQSCQYAEMSYGRNGCCSQPRGFYPQGMTIPTIMHDTSGQYQNHALPEINPTLPGVADPGNYLYSDIEEIPPQVFEEYCNYPHGPLSSETSTTIFQPIQQDHPLSLPQPQTSSGANLTSFQPVVQGHINMQQLETCSGSNVTSFEPVEPDQSLKSQIDCFEPSELSKMADNLTDPLDFCQSNI